MEKFLLLFYIFHLKIFFLFFSKINLKEIEDIFDSNKNLRFCGVDLMKNEINQYIQRAKKSKINSNRHLSTITYRPIRIFLESTFFDFQGNNNPNLKQNYPLLKNALIIAIKGLSGLLEVEDIGDENIYGDIDIINIFRQNYIEKWSSIFNYNNNINSDFLLIVKFDNTYALPQGVLASAVPIQPDPYTFRPIIGLLTVSIDSSFYNKGKVTEYFSKVFLHEITHALGFLYTMFQYYPGGLESTVATTSIRGKERSIIITHNVVEVAKKYFNCSNIVGVELEDQGGTGSGGSHWEQRILLGEYMGAVIYQEEMAVSEFTLALLEDSGWYKANYYTGGLMRFGKNKGCEFLEHNCSDWGNHTTEFGNEFFDYSNRGRPSCSTGRQSRTYSFLYQYYEINDEDYQFNFVEDGNYYLSGSIYTTDYCFTHGQHPSESFDYFTGNCKLGSGFYGQNILYYNNEKERYEANHNNYNLPKELGEIYSNTSFCIMSSLVPNGKYKIYGSIFHPMCYQTHCSSSFLTIQINDDYIVCPRSGGNVEVKGYDGKLHCPDYNLICTGTVLCNDIFDCIEKKSLIKNETYEYNYEILTTQQISQIPNVDTFVEFELSNDGPCPLYCSQCSKNKKCKICSEGYNLVGIKENDDNPIICDNLINLTEGYYKTENNIYYLCSEECQTCEGKYNKCLNCKENFYFLENSPFCYNQSNYPKGYYFNYEKNEFSSCHKNCETCSIGPISDEEMNCDSCKVNWKYDEKTKNCQKIKEEKDSNGVTIFLCIFIPIIVLIIGITVFILYKKRRIYSQDIEKF